MNQKYPSEIKDYSERLGVSRDATYDEIKTAYREKALDWHPDRNPEIIERAHLEFIAVSEAFEILSNQGRANSKSSTDEKKTYGYYEELFDKIFQGEFFNSKMSFELKTLIKIFDELR